MAFHRWHLLEDIANNLWIEGGDSTHEKSGGSQYLIMGGKPSIGGRIEENEGETA